MDKMNALTAFSALGHSVRLDVFRLLINAGDAGMLAGDISAALDVRQNTMSTNLAILARSGLIRSEKEGRAVRYYSDLDGLQGLLSYLMDECCGGRPELCQPILAKFTCP